MAIPPERWRQVETLFHAAMEQSTARRSAWLVEACAGDTELLREVEALLAQHASSAGTLDGGIHVVASEIGGHQRVTMAPGRRIVMYDIV